MDTTTGIKAVGGLGEIFFKYGAWGVCAVLIVLLVALYWHMSRKNTKDRETLSTLLEKRNNQLLGVIQRCTNVMTMSSTTNSECKKTIKENIEFLERVKRTIMRCHYAATPHDDE